MQISSQISNNQSFKAIKIANTQNRVKGVSTNIEIYKLTRNDNRFLEKLNKNISIKNLCPMLREDYQQRWQQVLNYCIQEAKESFNNTFVAVSNNQLCGILTLFKEAGKNIDFIGISSIPSKSGEKFNLAGQTLLYQLFKEAESVNKGISLKAIHNGPVDVVKKYKELGFIQISASEQYTDMTCNRFKVKEQLSQLKEQINYKSVQEEIVDLEKFLD